MPTGILVEADSSLLSIKTPTQIVHAYSNAYSFLWEISRLLDLNFRPKLGELSLNLREEKTYVFLKAVMYDFGQL